MNSLFRSEDLLQGERVNQKEKPQLRFKLDNSLLLTFVYSPASSALMLHKHTFICYSALPSLGDWLRNMWNSLRGESLGFVVGALALLCHRTNRGHS